MPEVQEVFRMATQKVRPDPGALERQHGQQRRRTIRRKMAVYGLVAALAVLFAIVAVRAGSDSAEQVPAGQPSSSPTTAPEAAGPLGTVTFDGSTCSMQITADRIEPGVVVFEAVNASDQRVMFDSWRLSEGFTFRAFAKEIERERRTTETGEPGYSFPGEDKVTYLGSQVISSNNSSFIAETMSPGRHAIVCHKPYEGKGFRPFGIAGPIVVR
jgi:hypothetical protein